MTVTITMHVARDMWIKKHSIGMLLFTRAYRHCNTMQSAIKRLKIFPQVRQLHDRTAPLRHAFRPR